MKKSPPLFEIHKHTKHTVSVDLSQEQLDLLVMNWAKAEAIAQGHAVPDEALAFIRIRVDVDSTTKGAQVVFEYTEKGGEP